TPSRELPADLSSASSAPTRPRSGFRSRRRFASCPARACRFISAGCILSQGSEARAKPQARRCPVCGKPEEEEFRPFCSKRCADIDLGRWLGERYRIQTDEKPDDNLPPNDED